MKKTNSKKIKTNQSKTHILLPLIAASIFAIMYAIYLGKYLAENLDVELILSIAMYIGLIYIVGKLYEIYKRN